MMSPPCFDDRRMVVAGVGLSAFAAHPPITLFDAEGKNVLDTGRPVSTMRSCARCHDTQYIATHSYHVSLGSDEVVSPGMIPGQRPWDWSPGAFARWNPLFYRYLSPRGDHRGDLTKAEWIATFARHVGGGPASSADSNPNAGVEMNCFLCHTPHPDNQARLKSFSKADSLGPTRQRWRRQAW